MFTSRNRRLAALRDRWKSFFALVSDPYRPERYYMRGPGPKWRAKYGTRRVTQS
ncbi:hypothetical protein HL667_05555 [Bradyrhizobium sp. 83012]|uniref:Uncharacterized protein n=1 Tax=Bradyrhizobium aeschynomenes TaxID=2734909 RepID=A0ABX2C869_9BRAD|nr:hypothetical protein [Bradyrhizobium aeschynomenes]NPU64458.1 hypothetical protein [Bradyrhizobium aeschynomenes]NPV21519.1 hypothetical protein [Bradyrhizobium aeschynomenes]